MIISIPILYLTLPWGILWLGLQLGPTPEHPTITYGEFPFQLQYEIAGELKTIDGTVICEYKGIGMDEASGKKRLWESRLSNSDLNRIVLLKINDLEEIYYDPGPANFYMGDYNGEYKHNFPNARYIRYNENGSWYTDGFISEKELYVKYKIKLLTWEIAPPIENVFN